MGIADRRTQPPARTRAPAGSLPRPRSACAALAIGATASAAQPSIDELNSQIARRQRPGAGARRRRSTPRPAELAAAQQQAIVAAQREAQLTAVLARGRASARRSSRPTVAERAGERWPARASQLQPLAQRALQPAGRRSIAAGCPTRRSLLLESDGFDDLADPGRVPAPDRGGRCRAGRPRPGAARPGRRRSSPRSRTPSARAEASTSGRRRPRRDRRRARRRRGAGGALASLRAPAPGGGRDAAVAGRRLDRRGPAARADLRPPGPERGRRVVRRLGDPRVDRDVRVGRQLRGRQPDLGRRRRVPDPALDLGALRRRGRPRRTPRPSEQSEIAAQIWADSGSAAWVCAGYTPSGGSRFAIR